MLTLCISGGCRLAACGGGDDDDNEEVRDGDELEAEARAETDAEACDGSSGWPELGDEAAIDDDGGEDPVDEATEFVVVMVVVVVEVEQPSLL